MKLEGKMVIILTENQYQELEVWYSVLRLKEEGVDVKMVGSGTSKTYLSKTGYPITVNADAKDVDVKEYDGLVIPGGYAPDFMRRYPEMVSLVRDAFDQGKVVAET